MTTKHQDSGCWRQDCVRTWVNELCWLVCAARWSMFTPLLDVCDADGTSVLRIQGSCCPCRCSSNQQLQVTISTRPKMWFYEWISFSVFNHTLDCLQHWWENRHNMEEMAWLQWWAQHGPWIFWVWRWVLANNKLFITLLILLFFPIMFTWCCPLKYK